MTTTRHSQYDDQYGIAEQVAAGKHREAVGGLWDELGQLQIDFLRTHGLSPQSRLLDIGCGSLRLGVRAAAYLEAGHYWGTDINESLLNAGFESEIVPAGLAKKVPRKSLVVDADFAFPGIPEDFDFIIAQSVFTHLPLNHVRLCLANLAALVPGPCKFFASFFIAPEHEKFRPITHSPGDKKSYPHRNPYHYSLADLRYAASHLPWRVRYIGHWNHPRDQMMVLFEKPPVKKQPLTTRQLELDDVEKLSAGSEHYRAYVGPPNRYDFISATQFALLFALGLRDSHRVLDFGCGSLRLGRLLIPFLQKGRYFGIDPNSWLIDDALDYELGRDILAIKQPRFSYNDDFNADVFNARFDYIIAQSILTHTGPDRLQTFLKSSAKALSGSGLLLFSYLKGDKPELPKPGWYYPNSVPYREDWILQLLRESGFFATPLPWYHPGASWIAASRTASELPSEKEFAYLTGAVLRTAQFAPSKRILPSHNDT